MYEVTPQNIWNFRQNNPELIIKDAQQFLNLNNEQCQILRNILLARGINKWLKVRRDLIAYKKQLKNKIKRLESEKTKIKSQISKNYNPLLHNEYTVKKELSKLLQSIRHQLKQLCQTNRWQIWPTNQHHHKALQQMNTLTASD